MFKRFKRARNLRGAVMKFARENGKRKFTFAERMILLGKLWFTDDVNELLADIDAEVRDAGKEPLNELIEFFEWLIANMDEIIAFIELLIGLFGGSSEAAVR